MAVDVSAKSGTQNAELTDSELRLALTLAGVRPCGQSPLADEQGGFMAPQGEPYNDLDVERLFRKGLLAVAPTPELKPEWKRALSVLADPLWDLSMILAEGSDVHYDRYYARGPLTSDSLVFFRPAHGGKPHHLSFPYGPADILRLLDQALAFATPGMGDDSGTEFSYKEYVVLLACIDALRKQSLESLLRREPEQPWRLALGDVGEALAEGTRRQDHRWLVTVGNLVSPFELQVDADEWARMLEGLQRRGYLEPLEEGAWRPTRLLEDMAQALIVVPAFSAFELTFNKTADVFEINYFAAVRGTGTLWLFDFYELATPFPKVSIAVVSGDELAGMLEGLVDDSRGKSEAALRARPPLERSGPSESRLPSPPTLRGLKVPSTVGRLALAEMDGPPLIDPSEAETITRARRESARTPQSEPVPPPDAPAPPPSFTPPALPVAPSAALAAPPADVVVPPALPGKPPPEAVAPAAPPVTPQVPAEASPVPLELSSPAELPCRFCGLPVLVGKKFCRHCGKEVSDVVAPSAPLPENPPAPLTDAPTVPPRSLVPPAPPAPVSGGLSSGALAGPPSGGFPGPSESPPAVATEAPSDPLAWLRGTPGVSGGGSGALSSAPPPPSSPPAWPPPAPSGGLTTCSVCALPVPDSARFCGHCGTNVAALRERTCPSCKGRLAPNARFCAFCGHSVT